MNQKTVTIQGRRYTAAALTRAFQTGEALNTLDRAVVLPTGARVALTVRPDRVTLYNWGDFRRKGAFGAPAVNLSPTNA